ATLLLLLSRALSGCIFCNDIAALGIGFKVLRCGRSLRITPAVVVFKGWLAPSSNRVILVPALWVLLLSKLAATVLAGALTVVGAVLLLGDKGCAVCSPAAGRC